MIVLGQWLAASTHIFVAYAITLSEVLRGNSIVAVIGHRYKKWEGNETKSVRIVGPLMLEECCF